MNKQIFLQTLKEKILILDGAMGTMLQKNGFTKGCPDELNLTHPGLVKKIHKEYADAGSNLLLTNTFGANSIKLKSYHLQDKVSLINKAAVSNARQACPNCIIVGDIGPLGELIEPMGKLTFDEAYAAFKEQAASLKEADAIIIETISDIKELKAAIIAAKEVF